MQFGKYLQARKESPKNNKHTYISFHRLVKLPVDTVEERTIPLPMFGTIWSYVQELGSIFGHFFVGTCR